MLYFNSVFQTIFIVDDVFNKNITFSAISILFKRIFQLVQSMSMLHYLTLSFVIIRLHSVIRKTLWMALAAMMCRIVCMSTSKPLSRLTSIDPRKRTTYCWRNPGILDLPAWDCQVEIMISPEISTTSAEFWFLYHYLLQHAANLELKFQMYFSHENIWVS